MEGKALWSLLPALHSQSADEGVVLVDLSINW